MSYKDLRMVVILGLFSLIFIALTIFAVIEGNTTRIILGTMLVLFSLFFLLTRYNARIFSDSMMVYTFMGIGILPTLIEFKDIKSYKLLSKHRISLKHNTRTVLYLVNASEFYNEFVEEFELFKIEQIKDVKDEVGKKNQL